jgi:hypothetical protein
MYIKNTGGQNEILQLEIFFFYLLLATEEYYFIAV